MWPRRRCREPELIVTGRAGVGDDGEAYGGVGEAREGQRRAHDGEDRAAACGEGGGEQEEGEELR
jgi:hypothetical protein